MFNEYQKVTRDRIIVIVDKLEHELGLDGWLQITHRFDTGHDGDIYDDDGKVSPTTAITTTQWQYRTAQIRWFLPVASTQTDEQLELTAIHELVHAVLAPTYELLPNKPGVDKLNEYVTESLCRMIGHARGMTNVR